MSLTEDERSAIVSYRVEKANKAMDEAGQVAKIGLWNIAANRMYYALYYAASALLIKDGRPVHTHAGMLTLMNQFYVKSEVLSKEEGRLLKKMFTLRQEGDYEDFVEISKDEIDLYMPQVEDLLNKLKNIITTTHNPDKV